MALEDHNLDRKSLSAVIGKGADWDEIAKDCVCFANSAGGKLLIGIEDGQEMPPTGQVVPPELLDRVRKRIGELTVNVVVVPQIIAASNGATYIELAIQRSLGVASTTEGRYYVREGDRCRPVLGDEVLRLAEERAALPWETLTNLHVSREEIDAEKLNVFVRGIRASDRVKSSVKEKAAGELLDHYLLAQGPWLTNLGILCVGRRQDRARLGVAPVIQFLKFDEHDNKVNKLIWDDYSLTPMELVEAVWQEVPDFREQYELPGGMLRHRVPAFDEVVIRELLVNALVHRPYTQRGDIFLNLRPDRLVAVNPGRLPIGVTPSTVLHESRRRNDHLARVFHDLGLMEREGSGFDLMYEKLLSQGRPAPVLTEGPDRVEVTIQRRIIKPEVIDLIASVSQRYPISQRERITLAMLAQHEAMTARELAAALELPGVDELRSWIGRLHAWQLVQTSGRSQGTRYFVDPEVLRGANFATRTTLKRIQPHRLEALILEDLSRYPGSAVGEINSRIGEEISASAVKRTLDKLIKRGSVTYTGERRWRRYKLA